MYCGFPADHKLEWSVENCRPSSGGGGSDITPVPTGDDPISGFFALLMLPFVLWDLIKSSASYFTEKQQVSKPAPVLPPLDPPSTLVAITTCERHRYFRRRFYWAGLAMTLVLIALWAISIIAVRRWDNSLSTLLLSTTVLLTFGGPLGISFWYVLAGPVLVDRVGENEVVLDRIRSTYFEAVK
jgi:hypothetical protein